MVPRLATTDRSLAGCTPVCSRVRVITNLACGVTLLLAQRKVYAELWEEASEFGMISQRHSDFLHTL